MTTRKRDRPLIDIGLMPLGVNTPESSKDISPRVLPPPPWLTGNLKVTAQGKTTQIGKRGITDWKSVGTTTATSQIGALPSATPSIINKSLSTSDAQHTNEFLLPNCPGATASPFKGNKKKLSPMLSTLSDHHVLQNGTTPV